MPITIPGLRLPLRICGSAVTERIIRAVLDISMLAPGAGTLVPFAPVAGFDDDLLLSGRAKKYMLLDRDQNLSSPVSEGGLSSP